MWCLPLFLLFLPQSHLLWKLGYQNPQIQQEAERKKKKSGIFSSVSEDSKIPVNETKKLHDTLYAARATQEFQLPGDGCSERFLPVRGSWVGQWRNSGYYRSCHVGTSYQNKFFHQAPENAPWLSICLPAGESPASKASAQYLQTIGG